MGLIMHLKRVKETEFKGINVILATNGLKASAERVSYKINSGMNMYMVSRPLKNWATNMENADSGSPLN